MVTRSLKQFRHGEKGFTLIELLVVIAILGVLAAVIVPNVGVFVGRGEVEAANTEYSSLQTAVMAMIADAGRSDVTEMTGGSLAQGSSITIGATSYALSDYVTGTIKGTYNLSASGVVSGATYPGNVIWDDTIQVWKRS